MHSTQGLNILFTRQEIEAAVAGLAARISQDYRDRHPLLIGVLKGSFVFLADLVRRLDFPLEVDFIRLASYGRSRTSCGEVRLRHRPRLRVRGRHVLVVDDIIDTGLSTAFALDYLRGQEPASLRLCALTDKPARRRAVVNLDYCSLSVPDRFIVGYGLDCAEAYRNLPDMYTMEDDSQCQTG